MIADQPYAVLARSSGLSQTLGKNSQRPATDLQGTRHGVPINPFGGTRDNSCAFLRAMLPDPTREIAILIRPVA
jgi:hypothetical protein